MMKQDLSYTTSRTERASYGLYAFGAILSYYMVMSFLQLFMTDIGIPAITVGFIFIIAKVWDAVNDPLFGVLVDKVNPRGGKYIPWLRIASIAIPLTTIFMFIIPAQASTQIKVIWSVVAYVLWDTAYTMYDVPMGAIVTAMTENQSERNKLYAHSAFFVYLGGLLVAVAVPMLFPNIGWNMTGIIIGLLSLLTMLPLPGKARERFIGTAAEEISIKEIVLSLAHNKYLLIFTMALILAGITNFALSLNGYFAIHCLGGEQWITPLALCTAMPVLLAVLFVPKLLARFEKFTCAVVTRILSMVIDLLIILFGYGNAVLFLALVVVKNLVLSVWNVAVTVFIADCVEYGQFVTGKRTQGIAFSTRAFTNKLIVALTGALAMFGLAAYGFVEGAGIVQSEQTINGIWRLYSAYPLIGSTVSMLVLLLFYRLRDRDVKLMIRCNNGEISREEAMASLSIKL